MTTEMNRRHVINQLSIIVVENDQMLDRVSDYDLLLYYYYYYYYYYYMFGIEYQ